MRKSLGLDKGFVFGIVCRVAATKFVLEFVRAAALVAKQRPDCMFLVVGDERDGDYVHHVRQTVDTGLLRDRFVMAGHREDIADVLNSIDVLVTLAGGSIMYEAMACGVPVLSAGFTKRSDSVHVVHDRTGVVLETRAPEEVAAAMIRLMDDAAYRKRLKEEALRHAEEHLIDKAMAEKTQQFYERILANR